MTSRYHRHGHYRSRDGAILGVCRGLADYAEISPFWVRFGFVVLALSTAIFPVALVYIILAIVLRPEPVLSPESDDDWAFYDVYASSRATALSQLKRKLERLDRRARRIEDIVTARGFDWDQRLNTCSE